MMGVKNRSGAGIGERKDKRKERKGGEGVKGR